MFYDWLIDWTQRSTTCVQLSWADYPTTTTSSILANMIYILCDRNESESGRCWGWIEDCFDMYGISFISSFVSVIDMRRLTKRALHGLICNQWMIVYGMLLVEMFNSEWYTHTRVSLPAEDTRPTCRLECSTNRHQANCHSILTFKKKLKTFLFSKHLCWFYCILSSHFGAHEDK